MSFQNGDSFEMISTEDDCSRYEGSANGAIVTADKLGAGWRITVESPSGNEVYLDSMTGTHGPDPSKGGFNIFYDISGDQVLVVTYP